MTSFSEKYFGLENRAMKHDPRLRRVYEERRRIVELLYEVQPGANSNSEIVDAQKLLRIIDNYIVNYKCA